MIASLILPTIIQPQAESSPKALDLTVGDIPAVPRAPQSLVPARKEPQPPDYLAIKKASDERLAAEEKARQEAEAAEKARIEAVENAREAELAASTPLPSATPPAPSGDVTTSITKWAAYYGIDANWLLRVAQCESSLNQSATNYGYSAGGGNPHGIFQFLPQTFYGNGGRDYDSFDDQARVAAYMFSIGQSGQWECR
jgi:hypothetical protein